MLETRVMLIGGTRFYSTAAGIEVVVVKGDGAADRAVTITTIPWADMGIESVKFMGGGTGLETGMTILGIKLQAMSHAELVKFGEDVAYLVREEMRRRGSA
jgi:hypothetical protein